MIIKLVYIYDIYLFLKITTNILCLFLGFLFQTHNTCHSLNNKIDFLNKTTQRCSLDLYYRLDLLILKNHHN